MNEICFFVINGPIFGENEGCNSARMKKKNKKVFYYYGRSFGML